MNENHLSKQEA